MSWQKARQAEDLFMEKAGTPKDDIERTYLHYHARRMHEKTSIFNTIKREATAFVATFPILFFMGLFNCRRPLRKKQVDAVCYCPRQKFLSMLMGDIPPELEAEYPDMVSHVWDEKSQFTRFKNACMDAAAFKLWCKAVRRHPLHFSLNLYLLVHFSRIAELIYMYNPKAIISVQTESDCSSSLMTCYTELKGIAYYGIMHGETMRSMDRAYVRFTRFYCWNQQTVDMFVATGSPKEMFRLYDTKRLRPIYQRNENPEYYISYYLGGENAQAMQLLREHLEVFTDKGLKCKVRYHPRATDQVAMRQVFSGSQVEIEEPTKVSLKDSLENAEYIVSVCSTVLSEAYVSGMTIVIDDMSSYVSVAEMRDRMYINLDRAQYFLSDLVKQNVLKTER